MEKKLRFCTSCSKQKPIEEFTHTSRSSWCRNCRNEYQRRYRGGTKGYTRVEFSASILSEAEMQKELKGYKPPNSDGLNAMCDFTAQFEKMCKVKNLKPVQKHLSKEQKSWLYVNKLFYKN